MVSDGPEVLTERRSLALLAPMLGDDPHRIPDVFERLAPLLAQHHDVLTASRRRIRAVRLADMVATVVRNRSALDVAVVHLYSGRAFAAEDIVSRVAERGGLSLVGVLAGGGLPALQRRRPRWVGSVLGRFDRLVAPSDHLGSWAGDLGLPVTVIPNPLDAVATTGPRGPGCGPTMFWMRAYHEIYRPLTALDVLEEVQRSHPDACLTMAGPDKGERDRIVAEVRRRGLASSVEVLGFVDDARKRALFESHDIYLNTSAVDNRPVSLVEAAASGCVVVSTDAGGIPALVGDGTSALLAEVDDARGLAAAVDRVVSRPGLAETLRDGGRSVAEEGRSDRVLRRWDDLLDGLG